MVIVNPVLKFVQNMVVSFFLYFYSDWDFLFPTSLGTYFLNVEKIEGIPNVIDTKLFDSS